MKPYNLALPTSGNLNTLVEHPNKFIFLHFKKKVQNLNFPSKNKFLELFHSVHSTNAPWILLLPSWCGRESEKDEDQNAE